MASEIVTCTGIAAAWCPIHGTCTCRARLRAAGAPFDEWRREGCPLHGDTTEHPDATWEPPSALEVLHAAQEGRDA